MPYLLFVWWWEPPPPPSSTKQKVLLKMVVLMVFEHIRAFINLFMKTYRYEFICITSIFWWDTRAVTALCTGFYGIILFTVKEMKKKKHFHRYSVFLWCNSVFCDVFNCDQDFQSFQINGKRHILSLIRNKHL